MWTRRELKEKGKYCFKKNYWKCVLVTLLMFLFGGGVGATNGYSSMGDESHFMDSGNGMGMMWDAHEGFFIASIAGMALVTVLIAIVLDIFIMSPLYVGITSFYIKNLNQPAEVREIGRGFDSNYKNVVKVMFKYELYVCLWSLLFIIPGIVKAYEYRMIPYLMAENPNMQEKEAFQRSRDMMNGQKWHAFVLDLSFIGWHLLGLLTAGILEIFYIMPYQEMTNAALYERLMYGSPAGGYYTNAFNGNYGGYNNNGYGANGGYNNGYNNNGYGANGGYNNGYNNNGYGANGGYNNGYNNNGYGANGGYNNGYNNNGYGANGGYNNNGYNSNGYGANGGYGMNGGYQNNSYNNSGYGMNGGYNNGGYNNNGYSADGGYNNNGYGADGGYQNNGYNNSGYGADGAFNNNSNNNGYDADDSSRRSAGPVDTTDTNDTAAANDTVNTSDTAAANDTVNTNDTAAANDTVNTNDTAAANDTVNTNDTVDTKDTTDGQ